MTQQHPLGREQVGGGRIDKHSSILDIIVKGVSLSGRLDYLTTSSRDLNQLLRSSSVGGDDGPLSYSPAIITLAADSERMDVFADGSILKTLCGGLDLDEWTRGSKSPAYGQIVLDMIRGLLNENIELHWILETTRGNLIDNHELYYRVVDVSLPQL
jgi:hypothetical protein